MPDHGNARLWQCQDYGNPWQCQTMAMPDLGNARPLWQCQTIMAMPDYGNAKTMAILGNARPLWQCQTIMAMPDHYGNARPLWQCQTLAMPDHYGNARPWQCQTMAMPDHGNAILGQCRTWQMPCYDLLICQHAFMTSLVGLYILVSQIPGVN
jgi:hypothetical protein